MWYTCSAKSAVLPPIHARDISLVVCVLQEQQHNKFVYTIVFLLIEREIQRDGGGFEHVINEAVVGVSGNAYVHNIVTR